MPTMITLVDGTIPVAADFMSNFNALNQAIGTATTITGYATGDTLYASATDTLAKLAVGTQHMSKVQGATVPAWAWRPRVLTYNITAAGTPANTSETDLISYALPAGTLGLDGQAVRITGYFQTAANGNNKTARLYFGATAVIDSGAVALNSGSFLLRAVVVRTGAATQDSLAERFTNTGSFACSFLTPAETLSGAITIKLTGENGTASASDLIAEGMLVEFLG